MDIKKLKPNPRSHFKQGYFDVSKSSKYVGEQPVIYRSGLEYKAFVAFEKASTIEQWSSEPNFIKITYTYNNKQHNYHIDAYLKYTNGKQQIVEIKPHYQVEQPQLSKFRTNEQFIKALDVYQRNVAKWKAAYEFAKANNMEFKILTDNTINRFI